ncbi:O-antigen ligase family protein [bacterium]|nr:O-antigen ligase family protein [bacterium]
MDALKVIIPIYLILFIFYGLKNIKGYLLLTGIVSLPFKTTYTLIGGSPHVGWEQGIVLSISDVSFILLFIYLLFAKKSAFNMHSKIILPLILFIVACSISVLNSVAGMRTLYQVVAFSRMSFLYYFVLTNSVENENDLNDVVMFLSIALLLQGILAVLQYVTGKPYDPFSTGSGIAQFGSIMEGMDAKRVVGTIGKPNGFAQYLVPLLLLNLSLLIGIKQLQKLRLMAILFGGAGLSFSFSRGGWIGFFIAFLFLLYILYRDRIISIKYIFCILVILIIALLPLYTVISTRIGDYQNQSAMSRIPLMKIAINMIKEHPFIGVGANTYRTVIHSYTNTPDLKNIYLHLVHNMYLLVFAEVGLVGIVTWLWLMIAFYKEATPSIEQKQSRYIKLVGLGIRMGIISAAVHMMVSMYISTKILGSLFILAGLLTSANKIIKEDYNYTEKQASRSSV